MDILLENASMINEGVLFEQKTSAYAGVFSKINIYNRRERISLYAKHVYYIQKILILMNVLLVFQQCYLNL